MDITFLYWEECMPHGEALQRLRQVMEEEGVNSPSPVGGTSRCSSQCDGTPGVTCYHERSDHGRIEAE
jgi:hypothetical protein